MVQQDKFVFGITPAPSPLNPSPIIWRAYTNDAADEINVVDERTNTLVGTIGGSSSYRFQKLPKSIVSTVPYDGALLGASYDLGLFHNSNPFVLLNNGNLAEIDYSYNHFNNGVIVYDCYDIQTIDPNNGYWVAFKPSEADSSVLEKIAEVKQTDDYYNNGWAYTYQDPSSLNQCKFIRFTGPNSDATPLFSLVTTLKISGTSVGSTIIVDEVTNNFAGATVLSFYNANAPIPAAPGTANWNYRSPYFSGQEDYNGMMNGVNEGWVWYTDLNALDFGFRYMAGFNILTGATDFVLPITALAATTNFNNSGPVDINNFNGINWESHPTGLLFFVYNDQIQDDGDNNNKVTGLFSPKWTNNKIVVFLNGRDCKEAEYLNTSGVINNNSTAIYFDYGFDGLHLVQYGLYNRTNRGPVTFTFRYKLDVVAQQPAELSNTAMANPGYTNGLGYYEWTDSFLIIMDSAEKYLGSIFAIWGNYEYLYWPVLSDKLSDLQSNNSYPYTKIDNRFYSLYSDYSRDSIQFGFQFDQYNIA